MIVVIIPTFNEGKSLGRVTNDPGIAVNIEKETEII